MATYSLQNLYDTCYGIIAQWQDSTAYPTSLLLSFINKAQNDICYGNVVNLSTNERLEKQALTFLESSVTYASQPYATLSANAVAGATTLTCPNTFPSSGYAWINGDIISYTGNNGTTLTGIPTTGTGAISFSWIAWTRVFAMNALPTDFWQLSRALLTISNSPIRRALIGIDSRDLSNPVPNSFLYQFLNSNFNSNFLQGEGYYSIIRGQYFFPLLGQITANSPISFEYQMKPTQLVSPTDILTIPDDYSLNTIPYMAVSEMLMNRGESEEGTRLNNFGFQNIKSMYQFYQTQRNELQYNQRVRTVSDGYLAI